MEETDKYKKPGPYLVQVLMNPERFIHGKKRITQIIAETWDIPEDKVLGSRSVLERKWTGNNSIPGERVKVPGESKRNYVNARKFYFYVMVKIMHYQWRELTNITGRKIAAMKYAVNMAQQHMMQEKEYMMKAQLVLDAIARDEVIFPKPIITLQANATVIDRKGANRTP